LIAKILELNEYYGLLSLVNGETISVRTSSLPKGSMIGDNVAIDMKNYHTFVNDKFIDFF